MVAGRTIHLLIIPYTNDSLMISYNRVELQVIYVVTMLNPALIGLCTQLQSWHIEDWVFKNHQ